ncbi:F-box protein (macronuclear) [Tetrahymena thermophila SB210]|uniref:F-box protein n=1 Tax=Tetrahymena thermophila (strain SB210) TaxID=312017 RepID=Q23C64_TETTS|nr:F-box protein [Tetrahymena thermophila SB210]EAR93904.2 F-box protein [Tetrahymena thermophila SB210]|eukprot:XP_001014149.2 F-box protein [Tetrahymena thermophila SB210]
MNSQELRSNSLQLTQQRSQKLEQKTPLKRIRVGENARLHQPVIQNRTSLSYIHTTSTSQINFSKHDIPNSPSSIVHLEQYFKESIDQTKHGNQSTQKGLKQRNFQEHLDKLEINKLESENHTLPPLKESSKQLIENNSNTISQLVQSCKKLNITSFGNIPFNNMSPKSEKGFHVNGANKIQAFNSEQINNIINPALKVQIVPNTKEQTKSINQSTTQNYIISQVQNVSTLQNQSIVKEKLQSLQSFCSPKTLSSKKSKQDGAPESKVESFASPTSINSKTEENKNYLMKKQFSEGILKLMKTDSPLRMQQSSFYAKNSYFNNIQNLNKTQTKDTQTYSSVDKNANQQQANKSSIGRKRATMQEFFTNRLNTKNNTQQDKMQSYDDFSLKQAHSTSQQTNNKLSSSSITQYSKLEDVSKILQMQVSNALTDVPRNRADLKELIKWFELIKKQNEEQNKYNINEKRKKQLEIIQVCFKELSHQIRIDFLEREQFFKMVWNENVNYYKSFIEDFEQIKIKLNTDADSEYNRVSNFYQQYIKTKDLATEEAFLEKRNAEKKLEEIKQELTANQQIQDSLKEEVNKFKKICMFLKKKLVTVTKELEGVMQRQEDRARHSKHQLNEYFKDQMQKLKQQGLNISQQNESTIQNLIEQLRQANDNLTTQQKQNIVQDQKQEQEEQQKNKNNNEEDEEEQEQEDDDNFTFEYNEGGDLVQGVDQLNAVIVNTEQEVKKECKETEVDDQLRRMYMKDVEVQTKLYLVDNKFDAVLYDVETMNDIFDFYVYKQQMDEQVDKFDVNQFMQQLGEQDQIENQNFVQTITNIRMDSIEESSSNNDSKNQSDSSNSSDSEESETEDQTKKLQKENKKQKLARQSKILQNLHPQLMVTAAKKDYDSLRGFQQRQSIRQRLSIRQNVFNSNRHLALYLEQYLSSNFINDIISIFAEKITGQADPNVSSSVNLLEVPSMLQAPRVVGGPRKSILNMIDTNPFVQKKRNELKQKLNQLLDPEKLKTVLDDAGLKVTSSNTESKLEKFVKIYQMSQLKGQELQVQLKGAKQMLDKYQEDLKLNNEKLIDKEQLTEEQKTEINRLEQIIRDLQGELEMSLKREKENLQQMKKGTLENIEESEMQVKSKQPRIFRQRREKKEVTAFQLGKKINIEWEFQKQQNSGKQIVEKAKNKKMAKFHNFMTVKTVLKQISMLYNERMVVTKENSNYKDIEFSNFVYNFYSAQYGVKKIADQKFLILILSIKKYSQILRINMFSRFLGLQEGNMNFTTDELNKYIDVLDFINNVSQAGTNFTNNESEQKYLVPYIKAVHYISQFGDSRMKTEENQELRREVENMKFMDSNKTAVLDFDQFMNRMLATYKILVNRAKQYVINAFNACDLDGNKKCNFNEWSLLNRHIEPDKFDDDQIIQIFEDNADIIEEDGEKNLSFDKFAVVSLEYELFSDEAQDRYLEITNPLQFKIKYDSLMQIWPSKSIDIQKRFYNLQNIDEETKEEWLNIIKVLDEKLNTLVFSNSNVKPLLIAYTILDRESNLLEVDNIEYLKSLNNIQNQSSQSPEKQSPI